jgi:alkanesulfonate monooxygenase SsuD/methylene tetrahydromethanopterin reductase-like flavin-dependent oxidoreductase (luciferase family)
MEAAVPMVSDEMVATLTAAGTAQEVRARIAEYRRAGITLPIMMPVATANETAAGIAGIIRACAE